MEKFLNEHCMTSEGNVTNENFKIKFKFDFLVPPYDQDLFNKARKIVHNYLFSYHKLSILHCKVDLFLEAITVI